MTIGPILLEGFLETVPAMLPFLSLDVGVFSAEVEKSFLAWPLWYSLYLSLMDWPKCGRIYFPILNFGPFRVDPKTERR